MFNRHFAHWPPLLPKTLTVSCTPIHDNLFVTARRYPGKPAIIYYGGILTYQELVDEVQKVAGFLQKQLGIKSGDRVAIYMQNAPQYVVAYYAILLADAVVVPINPMNKTEELDLYVKDCQAEVAIVGLELYNLAAPLLQRGSLRHLIVASYSSYANPASEDQSLWPEEVQLPPHKVEDANVTEWLDILSMNLKPEQSQAQADDLAVLPYTSGTTGKPRGCIHFHRTVQANTFGAAAWVNLASDSVALTSLPLFHVTGMVHSMHAPIVAGGTLVMMTRWNRELAARWIERYGCTHWTNISTMVVDFLAQSKIDAYRLDSLLFVGGGGASLPEAVGKKLYDLTGLSYIEGYGLTETMAQTHFNPPNRPKLQCLGIPSFDVDARVIDIESKKELGPGEAGEVVVHGPQVFSGYWNRPEETKESFIDIDGKRFFRTGDIARYDEEGYFFIVDRFKRMINVSGFKVWPTEVESILFSHPAVRQVCVVGTPDQRSGEVVKAFVILQDQQETEVDEAEIIEWAKERMAAYKCPRKIEFVQTLPMTSTGKILWRELQEREFKKVRDKNKTEEKE
ncbi:long-chain fatty acid--CoA ligase [Paenactinomyces guangxiensis]|uniref:Long-chain fatty acid--CoA ligase n=1 Tax=Paenactinomyces guangxiensis TaxID=1490290 RepID=A0A7W1WRL9_9BACL|nr:long-chain fatty acid--CoA ligase [Paenactinomyces guangxiensis]MBA4494698.1 long-chain fatty acid--CoA ligase [Paenactinomyces guangxiensis]MBH8591782.1 long-chain fatty acid--CoA ligase [Paenactinomyces guangxiensis]